MNSTVPDGEVGRPDWAALTWAVKVNGWPAFWLVAEADKLTLAPAWVTVSAGRVSVAGR